MTATDASIPRRRWFDRLFRRTRTGISRRRTAQLNDLARNAGNGAWPMAVVEHDGARVHWYELGAGEPVVLIMGLGCSAAMWFRVAPKLAQRHRVIMLDNRGAGRTEVRSFVTHRITAMARDVVAVLDAANARNAHIVGFSMGGMIAQQLAIEFPDRVRSLTLLGTNCGGPHAVLADKAVTDLLFAKGRQTPEQSLRTMMPFVYAKETPASVLEEDMALRLATYPVQREYEAQLHGLMSWTSYPHLPRIQARTLVMHGLQDQLIPPQNGRLLVNRIPTSQLIELPGASHWLHTDQPTAVLEAVQSFLARDAHR